MGCSVCHHRVSQAMGHRRSQLKPQAAGRWWHRFVGHHCQRGRRLNDAHGKGSPGPCPEIAMSEVARQLQPRQPQGAKIHMSLRHEAPRTHSAPYENLQCTQHCIILHVVVGNAIPGPPQIHTQDIVGEIGCRLRTGQ